MSNVDAAAETPVETPANEKQIRVLRWDLDNLRELVPGRVFMRHVYGEDTSAAIFRLQNPVGQAPPISRHAHGEEVSYIIKGSGSLNGHRFQAGDVIVIPAGVEHAGDPPVLEGDRDLVLFTVITPPRRVYGPEDGPASQWTGDAKASSSR